MRWGLIYGIIFFSYYNTSVAMTLTGEPSKDPRQLNFQLFESAKKGRTRDVLLYLKHGAAIKARDRFGNTALLLAAFSGRAKTVKVLLEAGSDINHKNIMGSTALYRAARSGKNKSVRLLLKAGAKVNALNNKHLSPLIGAAFNLSLIHI